jgi:serine/threonine protein phosphatase PrpC
MVEIAVASRSECGQRSTNEDRVAVRHEGAHWLAVLADGAGGHRGGAEAARRAVDHVQQVLCGPQEPFEADALTRAVRATHRHVLDAQHSAGGPRGMHTTLVVLWIDAGAGRALWTHVGDSRLYVARRGALRQLTSDDSVVQRMVDAGLLTAQQALVHPYKNQLVAALGIDGEVEPHTHRNAVRLEAGDAFLLCSDGWWGALNEAAILGSLADADSPEEWLAAMQASIESLAQPGQDNFSAIAAWVGQLNAPRP